MKNKVDSFYNYLILLCRKKKAKYFLYFISFIESIFFPFPTDPFLITYIIAEKKIIKLVIFVTLFSVVGGIFSYFIGSFLWSEIQLSVDTYYPKITLLINEFKNNYNKLGIALIIIGGFSPFPYKITCIASGVLGINLLAFIFFSIISRGLRFFLVSFLILKYGEYSINLIRKNILLFTLLLIMILFISYLTF